MREYDTIASKWLLGSGRPIYRNSVSSREADIVRKTCRKHGVHFLMCKEFDTADDFGGDVDRRFHFHFMFFVGADGIVDKDSDERYVRLMDCIHELDLRTGLMFDRETRNRESYMDPSFMRGDNLQLFMHEPVIFSGFGGDDACMESFDGLCRSGKYFMFVGCDQMKPAERRTEPVDAGIGSDIAEMYGRLVAVARNGHALCRFRRCPIEWLRTHVPMDGISGAGMFEFAHCRNVPDFSLAVVRYRDGARLAVLVRADGTVHMEPCGTYPDTVGDIAADLADKCMLGDVDFRRHRGICAELAAEILAKERSV